MQIVHGGAILLLIQHKSLCLSLIVASLMTLTAFTSPALASTSNVSEATQTSTTPDTTNMTVGEAFGNDPVLLKAVLTTFEEINLQSTSPLSEIDKMASSVYNPDHSVPRLDITDKMTEFQDLKYLKGTYSRIVIANQSHLSEHLSDLLDLINRNGQSKNYIQSLGLINDQLNDEDFKNLCSTIAAQPTVDEVFPESTYTFHGVNELSVVENEISDFSPLNSIYDFSSASTYKLGAFVGWGQHPTKTQRLSTANVVDNSINIDMEKIPTYVLATADETRISQPDFENDEVYLSYTKRPNFFYRTYKNDSDGTEPAHEASLDDLLIGRIPLQDSKIPTFYDLINGMANGDSSNPTISHANRFNSLDYQKTDFHPIATSDETSAFQSELDEQSIPATDGTKLSAETQMYNIPSGTRSVKIRALFLQNRTSADSQKRGYVENYEIPLNWPGSNASTDSSTSDSSESTTDTVSPKGTVVYATKKIGLYNGTNFTKKGRQHWYRKQPRINRPMFKVTGYANSTAGRPRYLVKDVNHRSRTAGDEGYITTQAAYVAPVYYRKAAKKITVINPNGVNAYRNKSLTGKATHYRQGQTLRVKKLVKHNLTTRYVLTNGHYITANKKLVKNGRVTMPKRLKAKAAINRYRDVNFKHRQKHYRKGTTLTVKGWDFSAHGTMRYRVAHGYVTANHHYIKTIH